MKVTGYMTAVLLGLVVSSPALANRPAAMEPAEPVEPVASTQAAADSGGRPAYEDTVAEQPENPYMSEQQQGDVLDMPATRQQAEPAETVTSVRQLDFPRRGMKQDKVENELGRPIEIVPPVGQPPITQWVYDDRVVYFEYSSVIHVVAR